MHRRVHYPIVALALIVTGCDPGYSYDLVTPDGSSAKQMDVELDSVSITLSGFSVLIGSGNMLQYVHVSNDSDADVILLGGSLTTQDTSIAARLPGEGEAHWRTVAPGETKDIGCLFDFWSAGGVADDMLSPSVSFTWEFQIGDKVEEVEVNLERVVE